MDFPQPLTRAKLVRRYKRFFADVALENGTEITAHCPNPGAMLGLNVPGLTCWVSRSEDPKRKLAHTLELVEADGGLVGVNTLHPNRLVAEALAADAIPELSGYASHRREVRYGGASRVDFLLEAAGRPAAWVEVKGVTLHRGGGLAEWPDCVSARGARHVAELAEVARLGDRAVVLFVVQRSDCDRFALARDLDPAFAAALDRVRDEGVEVLVYACEMSPEAVTLRRPIAV
ncbi:DNA/RNA nuclease SfsA [Phenylobacterium sp. LjRoot225]|uniref:DNA/RNA nuclease SfsA n=1 Tax=Phenylobacterium sp. LjRoot225 TaxID=3342285 RepID=UPI003ECE3C8E